MELSLTAAQVADHSASRLHDYLSKALAELEQSIAESRNIRLSRRSASINQHSAMQVSTTPSIDPQASQLNLNDDVFNFNKLHKSVELGEKE